MIDLLDRALRTLLLAGVPELTDESQVRFQPPDEQWRAAVANLQVGGAPAQALNVYLAEIRQNRELRSTARIRSIVGGEITERLAPSWVSCHYLITAWSPAASELVEPAPDEHGLLYRALAALQDAGPVNPARVYPAGSASLAAWPEQVRDVDLPTELLPLEGFPKLAEFWGTMGTGYRWKPVLHIAVGLPVIWTEPVPRGRPVATVVLHVAPDGRRGDGDMIVRIGGRVGAADGSAVDGAEVAVIAVDGGADVRTTASGPDGRYVLDLPVDVVVHPDRYQLRARLAGRDDVQTSVDWRLPGHDIAFPG